MAYCRMCKWCKTSTGEYGNIYYDCTHHGLGRNRVTGEQIVSSCESVRSDEDKCGDGAKWFDQRPTNPDTLNKAVAWWNRSKS